MNADLNQVSQTVIGCAYKVSNGLGSGFLESVYENALAIEIEQAGLKSERQKEITVYYRERPVGLFIPDLLVENAVIVEIKAVRSLLPEHQAQLLNYLKASGLQVGLLLNFGGTKVQIKRMVNQL